MSTQLDPTSWRMGIAKPGVSSYRWPADGVLGGAQIYKAALTANEVQSLAQDGEN